MNTPDPASLRRAAKRLAKDGQPVFPCHWQGERAKRPMTKNGLHDATTDLDLIKRWWKARPESAIGLPTGIKWDVLDVDVKEAVDGRAHLPYLTRLGLLDGCKRVVRTPSGGWHLYFVAAKGTTNKASAALGLDVRGLGGYVLAPPSYLDTEEYEGGYKDRGDTEDSTDEPLMWDLIVSALQPVNIDTKQAVDLLPSERRASVAALREWVLNRQPGERNNSFHWAVCRCIDNGIDPHELVEPAIESGLGEEEILATIGSALRRAGVRAESLDSEAEAMFGKQ